MSKKKNRVSERRSEDLMSELLTLQSWDLRRPPAGDLLRQQEYKNHSHLYNLLKGSSKSGPGDALPEAILVNRINITPFAIIETKAKKSDLVRAVKEVTNDYGMPFIKAGYSPLAIGLAGTKEDEWDIRVSKWDGTKWVFVTYEGRPINWIPNKSDIESLTSTTGIIELRPTVPAPEVLAECADEINRLLRESGIKDEFRPGVVGAIMLSLWSSKGRIRKDADHILVDINDECGRAFVKAKKQELAESLHVDEANSKLAVKARRIVDILERLNVTILTAEHDYLGQLYETFFRYTGGNTIGQYFTPRHITSMMADLCEVTQRDTVLDPACGTGGFLISAMKRIMESGNISRSQMVQIVRKKLVGFEDEPVTAALCVANMILRGDGSTGVKKGDCFTSSEYPVESADVVLMNPPFPHRSTDRPSEDFIDRALTGLKRRGRLAVIAPMKLLVKRENNDWRTDILKENTLQGVITLPTELFQPYASSTTVILIIEKGIPQDFEKPVFFAQIENDGFRLRKGVRLPRDGSQVPEILTAFKKRETILGVCCFSVINSESEWRPGGYIPSRPFSPEEIIEEASALIRSKAAITVKYAPMFKKLYAAIKSGELITRDFHEYIGIRSFPKSHDEVIGKYFEIFYGQKELETKDKLGSGLTPVISSSGEENGLHGFYDFDWLIKPPIVTVPRTGSMGFANVQEWPCGASSDNLLLIPRKDVPLEYLYIAAAVIRKEKWRFNYGAKITPQRIASFQMPHLTEILKAISRELGNQRNIEEQALQYANVKRRN